VSSERERVYGVCEQDYRGHSSCDICRTNYRKSWKLIDTTEKLEFNDGDILHVFVYGD
jgi:hypothetical protein